MRLFTSEQMIISDEKTKNDSKNDLSGDDDTDAWVKSNRMIQFVIVNFQDMVMIIVHQITSGDVHESS